MARLVSSGGSVRSRIVSPDWNGGSRDVRSLRVVPRCCGLMSLRVMSRGVPCRKVSPYCLGTCRFVSLGGVVTYRCVMSP